MTGVQKKGIKQLVGIVRDARKRADEVRELVLRWMPCNWELTLMALQGSDVASLIDLIVEKIGYRAHLDRTQSHDAAERWENIMELKVSTRRTRV